MFGDEVAKLLNDDVSFNKVVALDEEAKRKQRTTGEGKPRASFGSVEETRGKEYGDTNGLGIGERPRWNKSRIQDGSTREGHSAWRPTTKTKRRRWMEMSKISK
jgi:hypothetical protein